MTTADGFGHCFRRKVDFCTTESGLASLIGYLAGSKVIKGMSSLATYFSVSA